MVERIDLEKNPHLEVAPISEKKPEHSRENLEHSEGPTLETALESEKHGSRRLRQPVTPADDLGVSGGVKKENKQPVPKSETRTAIEAILQENLAQVYQAMPEAAKAKFVARGNETTTKIEVLIETMKAKAKTVLGLIKDWLQLIPGVNKFFLEQESKLKTDKIVALAKKRKKELKQKI